MSESFWESRWVNEQTGWDIGEASPPIKKYINQLENKKIKILIPGCGNAYEAEYLFNQGFENTYIVEISKSAIDSFTKRYPNFPKENIIHDNFFDMNIKVDLVIEQTFFCAINPNLRVDYVKKMGDILNPNGKIIGVLFNREFEGGPPFSGGVDEYKGLFSEKFNIQIMNKCYNSIKPRQGSELFIKLQLN